MEVKEDLKKVYSEQYNQEDESWRATGAIAKSKNIGFLIKDLAYKTIIEVGAGDGSLLSQLNNDLTVPKELYALEISESGIRKINQKNINSLKEARLFDGYTIPYPDKCFDVAVCSHVIEHVEHPRILLREIRRISKYQVFEIPVDYSAHVDRKVKHFTNYGHINIYNPALFRFLLLTEEFKILNERNSMYPLSILLFDKKIVPGILKVIKYFIWNVFPFLKRRKPNAYSVLTQ
jgi:ubiquinone/menaquinone biosynthesis C-methylase UbiE